MHEIRMPATPPKLAAELSVPKKAQVEDRQALATIFRVPVRHGPTPILDQIKPSRHSTGDMVYLSRELQLKPSQRFISAMHLSPGCNTVSRPGKPGKLKVKFQRTGFEQAHRQEQGARLDHPAL